MRKKVNAISTATIRRLPKYYHRLAELKAGGLDHISSSEFAKRMGLTASQIRQDLNHFGGFGQYGYGYDIDNLRASLAHILGIDQVRHVVVIGAGHLGSALVIHAPVEDDIKFSFDAMFDIDPQMIGKTISGLPVLSMDEFDTYVAENKVDIAVLTVPEDQARAAADRVVQAGIPAIWNFTMADLKTELPDLEVENIHISDSLMVLSYYLGHK